MTSPASSSLETAGVIELSTSRPGTGLAGPPSRPVATKNRRAGLVVVVRPTAALVVVGVAAAVPTSLEADAKAAIFSFAAAVVLWSMTSIPAAWVALASVIVLVALGGADQAALFTSLSSDVVWLMIGAFVLGGAVQATGLASRLTALATARTSTVGGIFWAVTFLLLPLSLLIPSTSGRAAVMLPVYRSLTLAAKDRAVTRALALLIPTVILVSTISTLVGAGSHLLANDLLERVTGDNISFLQWLLYGAPFGLAASLAACWTVQRLFLDSTTRRLQLELPARTPRPFSAREWRTVAVIAAMVGLWASETVHGIEIAFVSVVGAVALTMPKAGVLPWKDGVKAVSWNLVVFVGAALVLGEALIETGAAQWIIEGLFSISDIGEADSTGLVVLILALLSLTSHIYMTSHAARAAALVPAVLYLAQSLDLDPAAVMFISTVGMDYCLTFAVSSKALLLYSELDEDTFTAPDLLRLSSVLFVVHVVLMLAFYYGYWQFVGLAL